MAPCLMLPDGHLPRAEVVQLCRQVVAMSITEHFLLSTPGFSIPDTPMHVGCCLPLPRNSHSIITSEVRVSVAKHRGLPFS